MSADTTLLREDRKLQSWVVAFSLGGFVLYALLRYVCILLAPAYLIDDAYITLRYVQNLVEYGSFTYHIGDPVYGITTISYPLVLAALHYLLPTIELTTLVLSVNVLLEYFCLLATVCLLRDLRLPWLPAVALSLCAITNVFLLSGSQGGMETPFFCLTVLATAVSVSRSLTMASVFAGLALFTRPEGILLMAIVALFTLFKRGRLSIDVKEQAPIFLILGGSALAYFSFFLFGYGTLYPASVEVKKLIQRPDPFYAMRYFVSAPGLIIPLGSVPLLVRLLIVYPMALLGALYWKVRRRSLWCLLLVAFLNVSLYSIANPPVWYWYCAPFVTIVAIFFYFGLYQLMRNYAPKKERFFLFALAVMLLLQLRWTFVTEGTLLDLYTRRTDIYKRLVQRLYDDEGLQPNHSILTHEVGAIGYYSSVNIVDAVGLINPDLAHLSTANEPSGGISYGLATVALVRETEPDFIVIQRHFIPDETRFWAAFQNNYRLLWEQPNSAIDPSTGNVQVYKKVGRL